MPRSGKKWNVAGSTLLPAPLACNVPAFDRAAFHGGIMRGVLIAASLLALAAPAAYAQQADEPAAVSDQAEPGRFLVYFGFNKATLDANARRVVAEAADEYKRTGAAQVAVTGHADKAGRPAYNQRLSERRAEAVRRELERLGVPA